MKKNREQIMKRITRRLFSFSATDYFVSDLFLSFCRENDLDDAWDGLLDVSKSRPELFDDDVLKDVVTGFLSHIFRSRPEEFPLLFSRLLAGFMETVSQPLPLRELETDLKDLGCAAEDLEREFLALRAREENFRKRGLLSVTGSG